MVTNSLVNVRYKRTVFHTNQESIWILCMYDFICTILILSTETEKKMKKKHLSVETKNEEKILNIDELKIESIAYLTAIGKRDGWCQGLVVVPPVKTTD